MKPFEYLLIAAAVIMLWGIIYATYPAHSETVDDITAYQRWVALNPEINGKMGCPYLSVP